MPAAAKKQSSKVSTSKSTVAANAKFHAAIHPPWVDMIKECIIVHPDTRAGVSRPTIKKFVESKYQININAAAASQLNRAIAHGSEKGIFVLPKGTSGKVKLAPKTRPSAAKENKPAVKKPVVAANKVKPAATQTAIAKRHAVKGKAAARPKALPLAKKAVATSKKLPAVSTTTKKAAVPRKTTYTTRKVASAKKPATKKTTTTTRKRSVKKAITGDKRPTPKAKGRTTSRLSSTSTAKAKPASKSKTKPASKAKPASKPKSASKAQAAASVKPSSKASPTA